MAPHRPPAPSTITCSLISHQLSSLGGTPPGQLRQWFQGTSKPNASVHSWFYSTSSQYGWVFLPSVSALELSLPPSPLWLLAGLPSQVLFLFLSFIYSTNIHGAPIMCQAGKQIEKESFLHGAHILWGRRAVGETWRYLQYSYVLKRTNRKWNGERAAIKTSVQGSLWRGGDICGDLTWLLSGEETGAGAQIEVGRPVRKLKV